MIKVRGSKSRTRGGRRWVSELTTMIEATEKKLRETEFFYQKLLGERRKISTNSPQAFENYLSAFLSAGRAVEAALRKEEKKQYLSWFPNWKSQLTEKERKLFDFMTVQRDKEHHQGGSEKTIEPEFIPMIDVRRSPQGYPAYGFVNMGSPSALLGVTNFGSANTIERPVYYFDFGGKADVVSTCDQYLEVLRKLVREFKEAHPETPAIQEK
jgi:hypothetical protein